MASGAGTLEAQGLSGAGLAYNVQHRVLYQGQVSERTGFWFGGSGTVRLGPVALSVSGVTGTLSASEDSANPEAKVRATTVSLTMRAAPWLEIGGEAEARRFETEGAVSVWTLAGGTARLTPPLGVAGLRGLVEVTAFPVTATTGGAKLSPAMRGTIGVWYGPSRGLGLQLAYRFERFDFGAGTATPGAERLEQFRGIVAGAGFRIGR